jgi:hypothetical protein
MTDLIRAELRKVTTTRTWLGLTLGGLALVAFYVTVIVFTAGQTEAGRNGLPSLSDPAAVRTVYGVPLEIGYLMPLLLGVLLICGEFRHQTITPTFLAAPRRGRVLAAKAVTAGIVGLAMGVLITAVAGVVGAALIAARGYPVLLTSPDVLRTFAVTVVGLAVWAVFGLGFGALLKNQVAAVVSAVALISIAQGLLTLLLDWIHLDALARLLPGNASTAMIEPANLRGIDLLPWWGGALVLLAWGLGTATLGAALTLRRDVT